MSYSFLLKAAANFVEWFKAAVAKGGAAAHRFAKKIEGAVVDPTSGCGDPLVPQQALHIIAEPFRALWCKPERLACTPWSWDVGSEGQLPPLTVEQLDAALLSKRTGSALGWDAVHPRMLLKLPVSTKQALLDLMHLWENQPCLSPEPA